MIIANGKGKEVNYNIKSSDRVKKYRRKSIGKLTLDVYELVKKSDGPYFQKLREISHSNL